jgi:acetylornithine/N-succinyldiaminopimelate aminotransferase
MKHHTSLMHNYAAPAFSAVSGKGVYLVDDHGNRYLDFSSGIAVTSVGHSHPHWVQEVQTQTQKLSHCSNLYAIPSQQKLADRLVEKAGGSGKVLFCNSGAESNEALIKLARLHGQNKAGKENECFKIVCAHNAFHGRTFGGMSATPQAKVQDGFHPLLDGFTFATLNSIESFDQSIDKDVAAVFIESIQGEGGIFPAEDSFLKELRALCTERGVLLMLDEVQCGIGRTGHFFAFQSSGMNPDAIGMAKGLGGGFPIGAIWTADPYAELFQPGTHGTTFGGNPLASTAANAVLDIIEKENLIEKVTYFSKDWHHCLKALAKKYPQLITGVRGRGYMVGLPLNTDAVNVTHLAKEKGLLVVPAGQNTIRLLPALIATAEDLDKSVHILDAVFSEIS